MNIITSIRVKISNFLKNNMPYIILAVIFMFFLYNFNQFYRYLNINTVPINVEAPNVAIMGSEEKFPDRIDIEARKMISKFLDYVIAKEYDNAYDMISEDCKENEFANKEEAIGYMTRLFPYDRKYEIQAYLNQDKYYIYQVKIFDDFLKTGLTKQRFEYDDEKITVVEEKDGLKLNIRNYIFTEEQKGMYEDNDIKITLKKKHLSFFEQGYTIEVTNRSEKMLVLNEMTDKEDGQIFLRIGKDARKIETDKNIILSPLETKEFKIEFAKLFDLDTVPTALEFNEVRFSENYNFSNTKYDKKYNVTIALE